MWICKKRPIYIYGREWIEMAEIIKTWPTGVPAKTVAQIFSNNNNLSIFYFTLGRGKPKEEITRLWYTYHGRILGNFKVIEIVQNDGANIPKLYKLSSLKNGEPEVSDWQIKPDAWVAVCDEFIKLRERLYMSGFRGFRYFDVNEYRGNPESKMRL
jgi:hypothetical protein